MTLLNKSETMKKQLTWAFELPWKVVCEELRPIGSKNLSKMRLEDILNRRSAANAAEPIGRMPILMSPHSRTSLTNI